MFFLQTTFTTNTLLRISKRKQPLALIWKNLTKGAPSQKQQSRSMSSSSINSSKGKGVLLPEVVQKLNEFAPPSLAESWDNVGLLLEPSSPHMIKHLFLTNDLTEGVLEEAVEKGANMVLAYHPPIFTGIKRITQKKWKDRLIVKCLENRIAIYSPHTSYDNVKGLLCALLCSFSLFDYTSLFANSQKKILLKNIFLSKFCFLSSLSFK